MCLNIVLFDNFLIIQFARYSLLECLILIYCLFYSFPYMVLFTLLNLFTCVACVGYMLSQYYITPFFFLTNSNKIVTCIYNITLFISHMQIVQTGMVYFALCLIFVIQLVVSLVLDLQLLHCPCDFLGLRQDCQV